jgi:hypothetical protein
VTEIGWDRFRLAELSIPDEVWRDRYLPLFA